MRNSWDDLRVIIDLSDTFLNELVKKLQVLMSFYIYLVVYLRYPLNQYSKNHSRMNILERISENKGAFSKSERKVAEVILANPQTAIHSSIATLAKMSDVSEPTVNRFCRRLDLWCLIDGKNG